MTPQPMKMAEEYRFVTGGLPSSTMRVMSPAVCNAKPISKIRNAAMRATEPAFSHENAAHKKAAT